MTNDELDKLMIKAGLRFGYPFARSHLVTFSNLVAAKEREKLHKQVLEEICFKMAGGSPNRERIHKLIDTWVTESK